MVRVASPPAGALRFCWSWRIPVLFFTGSTLYAQTFGAFLFLLGLLLIAGSEPRSAWSYLMAGLLYGWLVLAIPMFLPSILVAASAALAHLPAEDGQRGRAPGRSWPGGGPLDSS